MKILFLCKDRGQYGTRYNSGRFGLWNSARLIIKAIPNHNTKLLSVVDGNSIDREVVLFNPELVVIEALWVTPEKLAELQNLHPEVIWIVRIHSKASFLAQEGIAFQWMNGYSNIPNVKISTNNLEFNNDLNAIGYNSIYLPNIYTPEYSYKNRDVPEILDIGCFGALRPMKNQIPQAIAAIIFAELIGMKMRFHINENTEGQNESILKNLRALFMNSGHELVEHPWMEHEAFCELVSSMDIGMQVSMSESFNIVTADYINNHVPVVASPEIKFVNWLFKCANTTNAMIRTMFLSYFLGKIGIHWLNMRLLGKHNKNAVYVWNKYLEGSK